MPTPPKPVVLMSKHLTKAEREGREAAEREVLTGEKLREWPEVRKSKTAHKHFKRISALYAAIQKDDALIEPVVNRYCLLQSECIQYEADNERLRSRMDALEEEREELEFPEYIRLALDLEKQLDAADKRLQAKRKMLLDIEKETLMTLKAQMAAVPKRQPEAPVTNKFLRDGTRG